MSKIGKKNILIPKDASIKIEGANLTISGPKGTKNDIFDVKIRKSNEVLNMKFEQVLNFIKQSKN